MQLSTPHTRRGRAERGTGAVDLLDAEHGRTERGTGEVDRADAVGTLFGLRQSTSPPARGGSPPGTWDCGGAAPVYIRRQSTSPPPRGGAAVSLSRSRSRSRSPEAEIVGQRACAQSGIADAAVAHTYRVLPGLSHSNSVDKSLVLKRGRFPLYEHPSKREARIRAVIRGDDDDDDDDFLHSARRPQRKPEVEKEMRSFDHTELDGAERMEEDRKRAQQLLMEAHAILKGAHEVARTALHAVQQSVDSVSPG
jgi:hypothetical protein